MTLTLKSITKLAGMSHRGLHIGYGKAFVLHGPTASINSGSINCEEFGFQSRK